jgi:peroxiredoxin
MERLNSHYYDCAYCHYAAIPAGRNQLSCVELNISHPESHEEAALLARYRRLKAEPKACAPDFMLKAAQGGVTRLSDLRDRPVILTFFTPSGWMSRAQIHSLNQVAEYQMAVVLGVAMDTRDFLCGFAVEKRARFLLLTDPDGQVAKRYRVACPPATFCIDPRGRIAAVEYGIVSPARIIEWLSWL